MREFSFQLLIEQNAFSGLVPEELDFLLPFLETVLAGIECLLDANTSHLELGEVPTVFLGVLVGLASER